MSPSRTLRIDLGSAIPAYRQIADGLRALLVGGHLRSGEQLAPVRQLAVDLGVHHNTVAEAYRVLAEEGWLDLARRRGARVLERAPVAARSAVTEAYHRRLGELVAEARAAGVPGAALGQKLRALARALDPDL